MNPSSTRTPPSRARGTRHTRHRRVFALTSCGLHTKVLPDFVHAHRAGTAMTFCCSHRGSWVEIVEVGMVGSGFIKTGAVLSWEGVQYCGTPGFKVCACTFPRACVFVALLFARARSRCRAKTVELARARAQVFQTEFDAIYRAFFDQTQLYAEGIRLKVRLNGWVGVRDVWP